MKAGKVMILLVFAGMISLISCQKEPEIINKPDLPEETLILNHWIWDVMNDVYLWNDQIPDLDPDTEENPEKFFYKLLYKDDRFSWIVDDLDALLAMFSGVEMTNGISAMPGLISQTDVIYIVEYVTPGSPAADSGVARGDIIYAVDGQILTLDNYRDLFNQNTATYEFGQWTGSTIAATGRKIELTAIELDQNPVVYKEVIDYEGEKIGYLVYTQFTPGANDEWLNEIDAAFEEFRNAGVSDVIMDLRYNPGGSVDLAAHIASTLGPSSLGNNHDIFAQFIWNSDYNAYWKEYDGDKDGQPDGPDSDWLILKCPSTDLNLNLNRVYFLTTDNTASACEMLISGLDPYADVVVVGDSTYGKFYGSFTIDDTAEPKRHNWAMQPIVFKYANSAGYTDFVHGLVPDYPMEENLLYAVPFGDLSDPLLAKALEDMTGVAPSKTKSVRQEAAFDRLPAPRKHVVERVATGDGFLKLHD